MLKLGSFFLFWLMMSGLSLAQSWDVELHAGSTSVAGGVHYRRFVESGFLRVGGSGLNVDDEQKEHRWGTLDFTVGTDTLSPGLTCEVGLRGFFGSAKDNQLEGDIGAVGFTGSAGYLFSRQILPIPWEVLGSITYSPDSLSFLDCENLFELMIGTGVRLGRNASIILSYTTYRIELTSGPRNWVLDNDGFRLGLVMHF